MAVQIRYNGYSPLLTAIRSHTLGSPLAMVCDRERTCLLVTRACAAIPTSTRTIMQISLLVDAKATVNYERPLGDISSWKPTTPLLMAVQVNPLDADNMYTRADIHGVTGPGA